MKLTSKAIEGFSLMEVLIVVAIIAIISSLLIPEISPVQRGAKEAVARQQQAELQTAVGNWIVAQSSAQGGLAATRATYAAYSGAKLQLLQNYLQPATYSSLTGNGDTVTSAALVGVNAYLRFSTWSSAGQQPIVEWVNQ